APGPRDAGRRTSAAALRAAQVKAALSRVVVNLTEASASRCEAEPPPSSRRDQGRLNRPPPAHRKGLGRLRPPFHLVSTDRELPIDSLSGRAASADVRLAGSPRMIKEGRETFSVSTRHPSRSYQRCLCSQKILPARIGESPKGSALHLRKEELPEHGVGYACKFPASRFETLAVTTAKQKRTPDEHAPCQAFSSDDTLFSASFVREKIDRRVTHSRWLW